MSIRATTFAAAITTCLIGAADSATAGDPVEPLTTVRVINGINKPIGLFHAPGDDTRLYVTEKRGVIQIVNRKTGLLNATPFLDIDSLVGGSNSVGDERGLLGMAFHPDYENNGYFYLNYTNNSGTTTLVRYTATNNDTANAGSAMILLTLNQPFSNHNGGWIGFSPENGFLYMSTGDGGSAGDPGNRAQDITGQLLGKMLRLDVDGDDFPADPSRNYAIPAGNPFVGVTGDDEIWAYGLRNAWRNSFDRANGDLYIADVGQNAIEELDYQRDGVPGGRNYGWRCKEGLNNFNFSGACSSQTFIDPYHQYSHGTGFSITGGYVYRGCAIPTLVGQYFFADYGTSRIWTTRAGGSTVDLTDRTAELDPPGGSISNIASFGEDLRGEVYILEQAGGEIYKVIPAGGAPSEADFDCDGAVTFQDLLALLSKWGACDGCMVDLDGDHETTFQDLLVLLAEWG